MNVVYDCGSSTNVKIVRNRIREVFEQGETIHALFLSHLDKDHINGVPYLLKRCRVEKIIFPLMSDDDKIIIGIEFEINGDDFTRTFIENPRTIVADNASFDVRPQIIAVATEEDRQPNNNAYDRILLSGDDVFEILPGNKPTIGSSKKWYYIPFNFQNDYRKKKLLKNLEDKFGGTFDAARLDDLWKNGTDAERREIIEAYKALPGILNTNTMTLYSGTLSSTVRQTLYLLSINVESGCEGCPYGLRKKEASGCLYTGDYEAAGIRKWNDLKSAYHVYWDHIGLFQIPHHGSVHNFNSEICDMSCRSFISAGTANHYGHPGIAVIRQFLAKRKMPFVISENIGSTLFSVVE